MTEKFELLTANDFINVHGCASSAARLIEDMAKHVGYEVFVNQCRLNLMFYAGQLSYCKQVFSFGATVEQQSKLSSAISKLVNYCHQTEDREITLRALHEVVGM